MDKFNFYCGYLDLCKDLSARQFRKLIQALVNYTEKKIIPETLPKKTFIIFMKIKMVLDVERKEYEAEKEQESLSEIRSKAGKKGMKHRWG